MRIILASASPRRKELISKIFDNVEFMPQNVDENIKENNPKELVKKLSLKKLNNLDLKYPDSLIISADTIVVFNNKVYGKPKDIEDAVRILSELNGNTHIVYTGVCIYFNGNKDVFVEESKVTFKQMTPDYIRKYVDEKKPLDKAGAYGVQDNEVVKSFEGSYTNIVGLPVERLESELKKIGAIK